MRRKNMNGLLVYIILVSSYFVNSRLSEKQRGHGGKNDWRSHTHAGSKRVHAAAEQPNLEEAEPKLFNEAAVAADHSMCSTMGKDLIKDGGTAADALVTTHCCVEIVNSHSTGLGGGGFIVYYDRESKTSKAYDFRETLPYAYKDTTNQTQGDTVLVPGVLRGLHRVWKDFGKLPWKTLWKPCIDLAKRGFSIHTSLANAIEAKQDYIMKNENLRLLFAPNGQILRKGETLKRPVLAETFNKIATNGADIFYKGEIANTIVQNINNAGGSMTHDDLSNYKVMVREPLKTKVRGLQMLSTPPPGSGALISLAVKIMSHFNWSPNKQYENRALLYHRMIEAFKFAYAPFSFLGDPNKTNHTEEVCKYMLDNDVAKSMFDRIDNSSHKVEFYQPYNKLKTVTKTGTTHISMIDAEGSGCACTTSINAYFGSKYRSKELGFIYNNELADFSEFWQRVYNLTSDKKMPGKKPMSKASPTIFVDKKDDVVGVFGAAGGFFIPTALTQSIVNWLFFRNNIKVAISKPRIHCQLFPPTVVYEPTFPQELLKPIENFGHEYVTNSTYDVSGQLNAIMGVVQAVVRLPGNDGKPGKLHAECDYRKGGTPDGF